MSDTASSGFPPYPASKLRIAATYSATDGSCPESIEIEVNEHYAVTADLIGQVVAALAAVPHRRAIPYIRPPA